PHLLSQACLAFFALLPAGILGLRFARPRFMPWWAVLPAVIGPGWAVLVFSAMLEEPSKGGAGHVGALFFGWAIMLVWFLPWLALYGLIQAVLRWRGRGSPGTTARQAG
ncbi:MAG: hypothetical protein ACKOET_11625, partial [Verrucomicrobiota bacterium]